MLTPWPSWSNIVAELGFIVVRSFSSRAIRSPLFVVVRLQAFVVKDSGRSRTSKFLRYDHVTFRLKLGRRRARLLASEGQTSHNAFLPPACGRSESGKAVLESAFDFHVHTVTAHSMIMSSVAVYQGHCIYFKYLPV